MNADKVLVDSIYEFLYHSINQGHDTLLSMESMLSIFINQNKIHYFSGLKIDENNILHFRICWHPRYLKLDEISINLNNFKENHEIKYVMNS